MKRTIVGTTARLFAVAIVASAAAMVVPGGTAHAAVSGLTHNGNTFSVPAHSTLTTSLQCLGNNTWPISGSYDNSSGLVNGLVVYESFANGALPGWHFRVHNHTGSLQNIWLEATCAFLSGSYSDTMTSITVNANTTATVSKECPTGMVALGGGHALANDPNVILTGSIPYGPTLINPIPRGWRIGVKNATSTPRTVWVEVVCATASNATIASGSTIVQPGQYGLPVAWCPSGRVVTGGGWSAPTPNQWVVAGTEALTSTSWDAWLLNPGASPVTANARAVCISLN